MTKKWQDGMKAVCRCGHQWTLTSRDKITRSFGNTATSCPKCASECVVSEAGLRVFTRIQCGACEKIWFETWPNSGFLKMSISMKEEFICPNCKSSQIIDGEPKEVIQY